MDQSIDNILPQLNHYVYFDGMVVRMCPLGLWLGKVNASDMEAAFLGLRLSVFGGIVYTKICGGHGDFDNINVLQQTACLVVNPITVATLLSSLIARRWVGLQTL